MSLGYIDSANLERIRVILERTPELSQLFGVPPRFTVVLDANIAVEDLTWKLKRPNAKQSCLEEIVRAGTVELHAPRWLDHEMRNSAIPKAARAMKLDCERVLKAREDYKEIIVWDETRKFPSPESWDHEKGDWKDVPYIELQNDLPAIGVLSRDKHIGSMGGNPLKFDFALSVQGYSRAASVHLTIMVEGVHMTTFAIGAIEAAVGGLMKLYSKLPPAARIALLAAVILAIAHPKSRNILIQHAHSALDLRGELLSALLENVEYASEKQLEAAKALRNVKTYAGILDSPEGMPG